MTMTRQAEFGRLLQARWIELDMTQAEFCRKIGSPPGWIQQIREGKKTPPLHAMAGWATVLGLKGAARQLFLDLAAIAHLPEEAQGRFVALVGGGSGSAKKPKARSRRR